MPPACPVAAVQPCMLLHAVRALLLQDLADIPSN
jgi:hypothetical protein